MCCRRLRGEEREGRGNGVLDTLLEGRGGGDVELAWQLQGYLTGRMAPPGLTCRSRRT